MHDFITKTKIKRKKKHVHLPLCLNKDLAPNGSKVKIHALTRMVS